MSALHELHLLYHLQNAPLPVASLELALPCPSRLLKQQDASLEHQEVHEESLLFTEQEAVFVLELDHLPDLLVVVFDGVVGLSAVNDEAASVLDVLEGLEGAVQIPDEFRQFIRSCLADVTFIDDED